MLWYVKYSGQRLQQLILLVICCSHLLQFEQIESVLLLTTQVDKEDAELILGTCHKAKGGQEDYVQLADDFAEIR